MITQREISQLAHRLEMNDQVIEKDYVLTWLLLGLADSSLADNLAFKGGTALKKIYFPDYRFSEDLDFTVIDGLGSEELLSGLSDTLKRLAQQQGFEFEVPEDEIEQRDNSLTVYVHFKGPLQASMKHRKVKIDFTLTELLCFDVERKAILSEYSDKVERKICSYSLEEVITEKLCAVLGRTEPRDIYDLNELFALPDLDFHLIPAAFAEKAASKNVDPSTLAESLAKKQPTLARMWESRLEHQVKDLPPLEKVLRELKRKLRQHGLLD